MSKLADYVESRTGLAQRVKLAFTYPAIVTVVALAVIIALLTYVVPQVVGVFEQTKQKLPLLTVILIELSAFVRRWGWLVAILIAAAVAGAEWVRVNVLTAAYVTDQGLVQGEAARLAAAGEMTVDAALVTLDFLLRRKLVAPPEAAAALEEGLIRLCAGTT
jgi:uncharacterized membrane protein